MSKISTKDRNSSLSGHELRSAETRKRLILSAIEVFGRIGYEAASTRELAKQAEANLSAINYHFGGKKELYLAGAQEIADHAAGLIKPLIDGLSAPSGGSLENRLETAVEGFLRIMLDPITPNSWAMFLSRCAAADDEAFHLIYDHALAPLQQSLARAVAALTKGPSDEETVRLRINSTFGALISFRLLPGIVQRGMGWEELRPENARRIGAMVRDLVRNGFLGGWERTGQPDGSIPDSSKECADD
jgi:AcrR family transcriptional regulator